MRQTGCSLVMEGREKARVAAPIPNRARTVAWANQARIVQGRASNSQEVLMEQEAIYVGIDVAKGQVDVAIRPTDDRWEVFYDEAGVRRLVSQLKTLEPVMVLLEASGGLELPLVAAPAAEAVPVVVVNPRQVRDFARATGKLGQDRLSGRGGPGSLCRSSPTSRAPLCETPRPRPSTPWLPAGTR